MGISEDSLFIRFDAGREFWGGPELHILKDGFG